MKAARKKNMVRALWKKHESLHSPHKKKYEEKEREGGGKTKQSITRD